MKKVINLLTIGVGICSILLGSCKRDDDLPEVPQPVVNEPEVITTIELDFTEKTSGDHVHADWSDPDGPGGEDPTVEDIMLDSGKVYDLEIMFLDESGETPEDITSEIKEEDDEHIICFEPEGNLDGNLEIVRTDSDGTYEVGLESTWTATGKASGELHLELKHQTDGSKDGTCSPGATDVEIHFDVIIN